MTGKELQEFLRRVYCRIDYNDFCRFFNLNFSDWAMEKYRFFRTDFAQFFVELGNSQADHFVEFVNELD